MGVLPKFDLGSPYLKPFMMRVFVLYQLAGFQRSRPHAIKGMTLLELLVVIAVVGVLSAIALPSFLNLTNRAKHAEAQNYVGVINRAQQTYFFEQGQFATLDALNLGIPSKTRYYNYISQPAVEGDRPVAQTLAEPMDEIRGYAGKVWINAEYDVGATTVSVLCEGEINEVPDIVGEDCPEQG